MMNLYGLVEHV